MLCAELLQFLSLVRAHVDEVLNLHVVDLVPIHMLVLEVVLSIANIFLEVISKAFERHFRLSPDRDAIFLVQVNKVGMKVIRFRRFARSQRVVRIRLAPLNVLADDAQAW